MSINPLVLIQSIWLIKFCRQEHKDVAPCVLPAFIIYLQLQESDIIKLIQSMNKKKGLDGQKERKEKKESQEKKGILQKKNGQAQNKYKSSLFHRIFYRSERYYVKGKESAYFHRKTYELPIESLSAIDDQNLGYTNQVLIQQTEKMTQLFVPAYLSLKVKNIQELNIKDLVAKIHCVLILTLYVDLIPQELLGQLRNKVMVQINRGEGFFLTVQQDKSNIKLKEAGKNKQFLVFTVRTSFPVQIYEDIFWSPFQVLRLVLSVTLNSITIHKNSKVSSLKPTISLLDQSYSPTKIHKESPKLEYNPNVSYQISFNCMRNPEKMTINYITGCRLGVYDLAQNLLESYSSNLATYDQIKSNFFKFVEGNSKINEKDDDKVINQFQRTKIDNIDKHEYRLNYLKPRPPEDPNLKKEKKDDKISYYQYSHFVIPIYKCPGNALATIFIPVFMLSLLSLSIFFQTRGLLQDKIGSIATFVLGFIALIPSIKDELPPSQKITFAEIIVYIQALNCMLSLISHLFAHKSHNVLLNPIFIISLSIHICCFAMAIILLYLHKFWWQKLYNRTYKIHEVNAYDNPLRYSNPYCDNEFLTFNNGIIFRNKEKMRIYPLKQRVQPKLEQSIKLLPS